MLVLTRKAEESIVVGDNVTIKVGKVIGNRVWLVIDAPRSVTVHRQEVSEKIKQKEQADHAVSSR